MVLLFVFPLLLMLLRAMGMRLLAVRPILRPAEKVCKAPDCMLILSRGGVGCADHR